MRVLRVNTEYSRGGAAGKARALHEAARSMPGSESLFAFGRGPRPLDSAALRFAFPLEVGLHALLTRLTGIQGYGTWMSTRRLLRVIGEWKPDVIHFHNIHGYYLDISIAEAVGSMGIPVVWTLHDAWPLTGRCAYFFDCDRWRIGCGRCPNLLTYPRAFFDSSRGMWRRKRRLLGEAWDPLVVAPSRWLAELAVEASSGRCRVKVIPNGVDTSRFHPRSRREARARLGLREDRKVVLFAAADLRDERKGVMYFLESLRHIQAKGWEVITVGRNARAAKAFLRQPVAMKQLGYLSGESLADAFCAADLYCITAMDDNFPTTVLESLSCGTPVVGFAVGGIPEQVSGGCGMLVAPRDVKGLARAIGVLLEDDGLRQEMAQVCREKAVVEYGRKRFIERYISLYREEGGAQ